VPLGVIKAVVRGDAGCEKRKGGEIVTSIEGK